MMTMNKELKRRSDESEKDYCIRICRIREVFGYSWKEIADILNEELGKDYSQDRYRKLYGRSMIENAVKEYEESSEFDKDPIDEKLFELRKEKIKIQEEKTQVNSLVRAMAREETLKEIASDAVKNISKVNILPSVKKIKENKAKEKGILVISDWHYGLEVETYYNKYNPEITLQRVCKLLEESIDIIKDRKLNEVYLVNLGDMISGIIHMPLRINSRIDVITQTMEVAELLAYFITELSKHCIIHYGDVSDNHSRLDPNKKESLQVESFTRIINWYLKERLSENKNVNFIENIYGDDIYSFNVFDHKVLAVHGDKDPQRKILTQLTTFTQEHFDLVLSAHRHHFFADEENETELYSNGALIGTDDYASSLRCNNKPSQLFIVADENNISKIVYKIKLS